MGLGEDECGMESDNIDIICRSSCSIVISIHTLARRVTVPAFRPDVVREKCHKIANLFFRLLKIVEKDNKIPINPYVARGANLLGI